MAVGEGGLQDVGASTTINETDVEASIEYQFPESAQAAIEQYGDELVRKYFNQQVNAKLQNDIRRFLRNNKMDEKPAEQVQAEVEEEFTEWDPTTTYRTTVDPRTAAIKAFGGMSDEEKAQFIQDLQQQAE